MHGMGCKGEVGQTSKAGQFWRLYHSMYNHTNYTSTILTFL